MCGRHVLTYSRDVNEYTDVAMALVAGVGDPVSDSTIRHIAIPRRVEKCLPHLTQHTQSQAV